MAINESSATGLIRFTGLGIVCFNREKGRGEIAAIRDNKHVLAIRIQKPVFQDGAEKDIIIYQDIATYHDLPREDVKIEIKALGQPAIAGYEIYQSGDFDRLGSADVNDFRWIVNMNTLHDGTALQPNTNQKHPLAKIYIENGMFYTHKLDQDLFFERVQKDAGGTARQPEAFGNVAETIGVKIEGAQVSVKINIGAREETHLLGRVEGLPYRIEIRNMDTSPNAVYSDMPDYYRYLSSPTGTEFDLTPVVEEHADGGAINQQEFCHPIVVDDPHTIDNL
jgi:hypothetical protein